MKTRIHKALNVITFMIVWTLAVVAVLAFTSCSDRGNKKDFPSQYSAEFNGQYNWAKDLVGRVGVHSVRERGIRARLVTGQRKLGGAWCWQVSYPGLPPNLWVAGLYFEGGRLEVGQAPTGGQIHWPTVGHEMVHHFLFAVGERGHHRAYDRYVHNWASARRVVGFSLDPQAVEETDILVVHPQYGAVRISGFFVPSSFEPASTRVPLFPQDRPHFLL